MRIRLLLGLGSLGFGSLLRWGLFGSWFLRWFGFSSSLLGSLSFFGLGSLLRALWLLGGRFLGLLGRFGFLSSLGLLSLGLLGFGFLGFFGQFVGSLDLDQSLRFHSLFQSLA